MRDIRKRRTRIEDSVGHELGRAFRQLNRTVSTSLRPYNLSAVQGSILITLWAHGPMPIGELQKEMAFSSSAFTGAIDRMERAELVRRVAAPSDRRSYLLEPVKWSAARRRAVLDALLAAEDGLLGALDRKERAQLLRLLRKVGSD